MTFENIHKFITAITVHKKHYKAIFKPSFIKFLNTSMKFKDVLINYKSKYTQTFNLLQVDQMKIKNLLFRLDTKYSIIEKC